MKGKAQLQKEVKFAVSFIFGSDKLKQLMKFFVEFILYLAAAVAATTTAITTVTSAATATTTVAAATTETTSAPAVLAAMAVKMNNMFVVADSCIGGRKEMEDFIILKKECNEETQSERGFFAICDGHGGKEAAQHTFINLWNNIKTSHGFRSCNVEKVKKSIISGFCKTHEDMWKVRGKYS